jgi:hypothetical protein
VPIHKWRFCPISALGSDINPRNIQCIPVVNIFAFLDLERKLTISGWTLLGHLLFARDYDDILAIITDKYNQTMSVLSIGKMVLPRPSDSYMMKIYHNIAQKVDVLLQRMWVCCCFAGIGLQAEERRWH